MNKFWTNDWINEASGSTFHLSIASSADSGFCSNIFRNSKSNSTYYWIDAIVIKISVWKYAVVKVSQTLSGKTSLDTGVQTQEKVMGWESQSCPNLAIHFQWDVGKLVSSLWPQLFLLKNRVTWKEDPMTSTKIPAEWRNWTEDSNVI